MNKNYQQKTKIPKLLVLLSLLVCNKSYALYPVTDLDLENELLLVLAIELDIEVLFEEKEKLVFEKILLL